MNTTPPLLPEARFKPLSAARLDGMITHALTHRQLPQQAQIIAFRRPWTATVGLAAMAASIMLAFMATPQYTTTIATTGTDLAQSESDVSDLLLLDSFGA